MFQGFAGGIQRVDQHVEESTGNSSTANLNAGNAYTFTGTAISTLGVNSIQVMLFTDQNAMVFVDQSADQINWDLVDEFQYFASTSFGTTVQAIASYARVRVVTASLTTTVFRLNTVLCPIADPLPRALDENGHLKTHVLGIADHYGFDAENTPVGELRTVIPTRLVGIMFDGTTIDPNFWTSTTANAATITQAGGVLTLASGVNAAGSAQFNSNRRARYVTGATNSCRCVVQLGDTGAANNTRRWGIGFGAAMPTLSDGAWFQLSGTTFGIATMKAGVITVVNSGSFNMQFGKTFSPGTTAHVYEMYWNNGWIYFVIDGDILHKVTANTTTWADTMAHYIYISNINTGNTTNVTLSVRVISIRRLGPLLTQPISRYQSGTVAALVLKYGPGNLHTVIISGVNNNAVITLYDNTAAAGTVIFSTGAMGALTTPFALDFQGAPWYTGLTLAITGANANATVVYE